MLSSLSISKKIPVFIVLISTLGLLASMASSYINSKNTVKFYVEEELTAIATDRQSFITQYLESIVSDITFIATNRQTADALKDFSDAWAVLGYNQKERLQKAYITGNPNPTGEKENLDAADSGTLYDSVHAYHHPWFRQFLRERGYYDIFLFDLDGNLIYTVFKELDYATNLNSGEWKDSDLGNAFRAAAAANKEGEKFFFDFKPYAPSADAPASFIATPVFDDGKKIGVLAFQMPIERINKVMGQTAGLGETGESYIVGADYLMRSDSRFSEESTILKRKVETPTVKKAINGESGIAQINDYRNVPVFSAYTPIDFMNQQWAVIVEKDVEEVEKPLRDLLEKQLLLLGIILAAVVVIGILISRSIVKPLKEITEAADKITAGDNDVEVKHLDRKDEVGQIAATINQLKETQIEQKRLEAEQADERLRAENEKRESLNNMADSLDTSVGGLTESLAQDSAKLGETSTMLSTRASEGSQLISSIIQSVQDSASSVSTVASATEELSSSIGEISMQVANATSVTNEAVQEMENTSSEVKQLNDKAAKIGEVVAIINDITEQINLLSLNATIEAARAGEAGKGFAVVASEVKQLAEETAKATTEIAQSVQEMQNSTNSVVSASDRVSSVIGRIHEVATAISAAVEEQSSTTQEISHSVQQAAGLTNKVSEQIGEVGSSVGETATNTQMMSGVVESLNTKILSLSDEVKKFVESVRS